MEITLNKKDETFGSLNVQLVESDYKDRVNKKVKEFGKKAKIKGFRPGKVPTSVIMRMAGDSLVSEEVYAILSESVQNYIKENDIQTIGDPIPSEGEGDKAQSIDWRKDTSFDFNFDLGLVPEFKAEINGRFKFDYLKIKVDKSEIDDAHNNLTKQHAKQEEVESVEVNDYIYGEVKKVGADVEGHETLLLSERIVEEFTSIFVGKSSGDIVTFEPKKVFEEEKFVGYFLGVEEGEALDAIEGNYEFRITKISRQGAPELNQEFFDLAVGAGKATNEEEYRAQLSELIAKNYERDADAHLYFAIQEKLIEKSNLIISEEFSKRWILLNNKEITPEKLEEDLDKYLRELKWSIIKNKLVTDNDLKIEEEDVKSKAGEMLQAQYFGGQSVPEDMAPMFENFIDNYLKEGNGRNYYGVIEQVIADKLFIFFKEKVGLTDKEVTVEEFKKIITEK